MSAHPKQPAEQTAGAPIIPSLPSTTATVGTACNCTQWIPPTHAPTFRRSDTTPTCSLDRSKPPTCTPPTSHTPGNTAASHRLRCTRTPSLSQPTLRTMARFIALTLAFFCLATTAAAQQQPARLRGVSDRPCVLWATVMGVPSGHAEGACVRQNRLD